MNTESSSSGQRDSTSKWVADFETTTDPDDCRVWVWGLCDIENTDAFVWGKDIDSFCEYMSSHHSQTYFHNLAFDGSFLIDYLLRNGYKHRLGNSIRPKQFTTLISNMGKFYSITVRWANGKRTEFRDSLKKLPMSVKNVAKTFKLDESKGEIDYHKPRPIGYEPTEAELEYLRKDVSIVAKALQTEFAEGMTRLTVGSDSLAEFKRLTGSKIFSRVFPVLSHTMDAEIRKAYRGGFTYPDPRFKGRRIGPGRVYDVNSLYPSVMYNNPLPYGEPVFFPDKPNPTEDYPLFIVSLTFTARLRENHVPCIQIKNSPFFVGTMYQEVIEEPVTMACTNVDLALWHEHYDLEIHAYNGGWAFHSVSGIFTDFIDKWMDIKANSDGGRRAIAKLHLNSLYGKFATNPNVTPKIPILENGVVKLVMGDEETRNPVYTAMGVFITAYARDVTIRAAQAHYDSFIYADTDSLHLLVDEDPTTLDVDSSRLGAWKMEARFEEAIFVRAKCYIERLTPGTFKHRDDCLQDLTCNCNHSTHVAGLPDVISDRMTLDDFTNGRVFDGKLLPQRVRGGIVLTDVGFTLNIE